MPVDEVENVSAPKELADPRLVAAIDHPWRAHVLAITNQRVASQAEMAADLRIKSRQLSYHIEKLLDLGLIELVKEEKTPGGRRLGRWFRAIGRSWAEADQWKTISKKNQTAVTSKILSNCNLDLQAAIAAGTIHGDDNVIARIPLAVDGPGWKELCALLNDTTKQAVEIAERSAARMKPGGELTPAKVHIIQFESPGPTF